MKDFWASRKKRGYFIYKGKKMRLPSDFTTKENGIIDLRHLQKISGSQGLFTQENQLSSIKGQKLLSTCKKSENIILMSLS